MAVTRDELLKMIGEKLGQSAGGGQQRTQPTEKSDEERAKYKALADKEYQRVQSVKKLSGTYNPVERERAQMAQRDALVAADNETKAYRKNAALAQKEYDDYVTSPEYRKKLEDIITENFSASETPTSMPRLEDDRAKELKDKAKERKKPADDEIRKIEERRAALPSPSAVKETPVQFSPVYTPGYERQYNMPEIAADNVVPYLREITLAQKEYDDYVASPEFQQKKRDAAAQMTRGVLVSEIPRNAPQMMETFEDETAQGLKAKADYYRKLSNDEKSRRIMAQDMAEINAMPEEDRKLFEQYAESVNAQQDVFAYTNPILWFWHQNDVADAWKPLAEKYGEEHLAELKESYNWYASQQMAEQIAQDVHANNDAAGSAITQQIIGFPARAMGGVEAMAGRIFELGDRTGRYPTLSPYTPNDAMSVFGNDVTADTSARIAGDGDSMLRKGLSAGYQAVTSAVDSGTRMLLGGGASGGLALAGINSFTDTLREASQKGATPEQAYLLATVSGGLEVLTEKVSLDKALEKAKQLGGSDLRKWVLNTIGQGGVEISEETASFIGNFITEASVLQGKSEYNQTIGELVANGMSYEEAKAQANQNVVDDLLNTWLVSGLSGSIMGAGTTAYSDVMTKLSDPGGTVADTQGAAGSQQAGISPEASTDTTNAQSPEAEAAATPQATNEPIDVPGKPAAEAATTPPVTNKIAEALDEFSKTGGTTDETADAILSDPEAVRYIQEQLGFDLRQQVAAERLRRVVKRAIRLAAGQNGYIENWPWSELQDDSGGGTEEAPGGWIDSIGRELAERAPARQETPEVPPERQAVQNAFDRVLGVDTGTDGNYNAINGNPIQGGIENAGTAEQGTAQGAGNQLYGAPGEGVQQVQGSTEHYSQSQESGALGQGHLRGSGEFLLSETAQKALSEKGSPDVRMYQDSDAQTFVDALNEGRNSDVKNGWCVSPKEVSDLTQPGVKSYLAENGQAGFVINNGDIEAVFTNKAKGAPKGLADSLMLRALSAGGNKLDCYGETLATIYSRYGFEPVARVEFNREVANPGWDASKGEPYVYVMKHNGDSADTVARKMGTYPEHTKDQLEALPTYGKNDYDAALAYRDSLMGKGSPQVADSSGKSTGGGQVDTSAKSSVGAADRNFTGAAAYDDLLSDDNVQPRRASDAKNVEVPKTDTYGRNVSEFAHNAMNSDIISDRDIDTAKRLVQEGAFGHETQKMADVRDRVYDEIQKKDVSASVREVSRAAAGGKISEYDIAKAQVLFAMLADKKGARAENMAGELLVDLGEMATQSGRQLNMFKLLRKLTPEGQISAVESNINRHVDALNEHRSEKKQVNVEIPAELEQDYLNAARDEASPENAVASGIANAISETMETEGGELAEKCVKNALDQYSNSRYFGSDGTEPNSDLLANDMAERVGQRGEDPLPRQANERRQKVGAGRGKNTRAKNQNLEALRDHYWYLGIENETPDSAVDYADPKSTLRKGTKEAATAAGIRMDNRSETKRDNVRQEMRDVLVESAQEKEAAANRIAEIAMEGLDLDEESAKAMADDIVRAFYSDLAERSARRVAAMFSRKENGNTKTVQKTLSRKLEELYNMGAFSHQEYRTAIMESLFGRDDIDIPDSLIEKFVQAAGEQKQKALDQIYASAAAQIPATLKEKFDSLRHLSMLGAPLTHIRNFGATGAFRPMSDIKRTISAGIQALTLDQKNRTAAVIGLGKGSRALLSWAKNDAKSDMAVSMMKGTYQNGDNARSEIESKRTIFKNKALEGYRKLNSNALEAEDMVWKKQEYALTLASFLKARGYTVDQVTGGAVPSEVMAEGRELAVKESLKSTFNDRNKFSDAISKFRKKGSDPWSRSLDIMAQGILPYTRTPANLAVRAVEYSPAGLAKAAYDLTEGVKSGKITAAQGIDNLASGLTGTGMMFLGGALAAGIIPGVRLVGAKPDDDEGEENTQEYALEIGDLSIGISWLAPVNIPLFIGANLYNKIKAAGDDGDVDPWNVMTAIVDSTASILDPVLELSCMSGLNSAVDNMKYEDTAGDKFIATAYSAATGYFLQAIPTLFGRIEKGVEPNKKRTFSNGETAVQRSVERTLGGAFQKLPGDPFQIDKVDAYGNVVKDSGNPVARLANALLNPFNVQKIDRSELTQEIKRLSGVQPDKVNMPSAPRTVSYTDTDGNHHDNERLTAEQYSTLEKTQKQTAAKLLGQVIGTDIYKAMTDDQKADVFGYVYNYAREKGRAEAIDGYPGLSDSWMQDVDKNGYGAIVEKVVTKSFSNAFTSMDTSALENAYGLYSAMDKDRQKQFRENNRGRVGYYITAKEKGVSDGVFTDLYDTYKELDGDEVMTDQQKAQEWSRTLAKAYEDGKITKAAHDALKEEMAIWQNFPVDTVKFDAMTESGLSSDVADRIIKGLADLQGTGSVDKDTGENRVTDRDKWGYIAALDGLSDKEKDRVMLLYMPDYNPEAEKPNKTELKYAYLRGRGYSAEQFTQTYGVTQEFTKKADMIAAWVALGYSSEEAQMFYKLYKGKLV